jgi:hypothetical protein
MRGFREGLQAPREIFIDAKFDRPRGALIPSAHRSGKPLRRTRNRRYTQAETPVMSARNAGIEAMKRGLRPGVPRARRNDGMRSVRCLQWPHGLRTTETK